MLSTIGDITGKRVDHMHTFPIVIIIIIIIIIIIVLSAHVLST